MTGRMLYNRVGGDPEQHHLSAIQAVQGSFQIAVVKSIDPIVGNHTVGGQHGFQTGHKLDSPTPLPHHLAALDGPVELAVLGQISATGLKRHAHINDGQARPAGTVQHRPGRRQKRFATRLGSAETGVDGAFGMDDFILEVQWQDHRGTRTGHDQMNTSMGSKTPSESIRSTRFCAIR